MWRFARDGDGGRRGRKTEGGWRRKRGAYAGDTTGGRSNDDSDQGQITSAFWHTSAHQQIPTHDTQELAGLPEATSVLCNWGRIMTCHSRRRELHGS